MVVVFPAPFGPRKANSSPARDLEADVVDRRGRSPSCSAWSGARRGSSCPWAGSSSLGGPGGERKWEHCSRFGNTVRIRVSSRQCRSDRTATNVTCVSRCPRSCAAHPRPSARRATRCATSCATTSTSSALGHGTASRSEVVWDRLERATPRARREVARIVAAAIEVADRDGLDALSMRRLAASLGTGTTSCTATS